LLLIGFKVPEFSGDRFDPRQQLDPIFHYGSWCGAKNQTIRRLLEAISLSAPEHTISVFHPVGLGERLAANFFANFEENQDGCEQL
jgi:hypothetical protein